MTATAFDWEAEGVRIGDALDRHHAIVVLGTDDEATARVALGIGRAQAPRRRVAIGDLLGEAPPLHGLVDTEDPHGLVDSFEYGVSLNRIAREVPGAPGLYVMPTGSGPVDAEAIFPNARWRRLASGFREVGALLVLAARADAPGVATLAGHLDGAVLVGDAVPTMLPVAAVIASVRRPSRAASSGPVPVRPANGITAIEEPARRRLPTSRVLQGAAALVVLSAIALWFAARPFASQRRGYAPAPDTARPTAAVPGVTAPDTAGAPDTALVVRNPADSARASAFAVEMVATNTMAGAAARVREESERTPASTFTPAVIDGSEWFKVVAGAYVRREAADSLLASLRQRGQLDDRSGTVVRLPYAYLVNSAVAPDKVQGLLNAYRDLGQPVYALEQADGTANVYAGAFESPAQAALLMESLQAAGIAPTLVFRTGRTY